MPLAQGISEAKAGRNDDWVEWEEEFWRKSSKTGGSLASPNDAYVIANSVTNVIVKDL